MTPETLTCDKCGARLRIETDDPKFMEDKKLKFEKDHSKCKPASK